MVFRTDHFHKGCLNPVFFFSGHILICLRVAAKLIKLQMAVRQPVGLFKLEIC